MFCHTTSDCFNAIDGSRAIISGEYEYYFQNHEIAIFDDLTNDDCNLQIVFDEFLPTEPTLAQTAISILGWDYGLAGTKLGLEIHPNTHSK